MRIKNFRAIKIHDVKGGGGGGGPTLSVTMTLIFPKIVAHAPLAVQVCLTFELMTVCNLLNRFDAVSAYMRKMDHNGLSDF